MTRNSFNPKIRRWNVLRHVMSNVLRRWVKSPSLDWTRLFSPHPSWPMSAFVPSLNDSDWSVNLQLTRSFRSSKKYFKSQNYRKWRQSRWIFWVYWLRELSRDKGRHARLVREKTKGTLQWESSNIITNSYFNYHAVEKDLWTTFENQTNLNRFYFYFNFVCAWTNEFRIIRVQSLKIFYSDSVEVSILNFSVDITTKWLADIKLDVCHGSFFFNK